MRDLRVLNEFRYSGKDRYFNMPYNREYRGNFLIPGDKGVYFVRAARMPDWDHLCVFVLEDENGIERHRMPTSEELHEIFEVFFEDDEVGIEVYPTTEEYVNIEEFTLHLWRPVESVLPEPPRGCEYVPQELIHLEETKMDLLISVADSDGWRGYKVQVRQNGYEVNRLPNWTEMAEAKARLCGGDAVALQYHSNGDTTEDNALTFWVPPKDLDIPLPKPFMVGIRNDKDFIGMKQRAMYLKQKYDCW